MPDSSVPRVMASTISARSSSEERIAWRISTISWSPISLRAHWMAPMPMHSSARPSVEPSARLDAPRPAKVSSFWTAK